jgi:hypothetical protein
MHPLVSPGAGPIPGVPQQQPSNLFRFGEITLYSTHFFPDGTPIANTANRVFSTQLGQTGQGYVGGLSRGETNLKEGGRIPTGQAYDVYGVACQVIGVSGDPPIDVFQDASFQATTPANSLQNVINNGVLAWDFTQTNVDICPIMLAGAGGGVYGAVSTDNVGTNIGALNNGNGGIWMYRKHPVALPGATTFAVIIGFGSRAADIGDDVAGLAIRVVLLGYYKSVIEIG